MPIKRRRKKAEDQHAYLAVKVESHEARMGASVNHYAYEPQYAWDLDENDPLYEFTIDLTIAGVATWPEAHAGEMYELTIYGNDASSSRHSASLKDVQARDKNGLPQYREFRGKRVPVLNPPNGIGYLEKVRGESRWTAALFVPNAFAGNLMALLDRSDGLFLSIHERKLGRMRWIQGVSLQTTDPSIE